MKYTQRENDAAITIQRSVRRYLRRNKSVTIKSSVIDNIEDNNRREDDKEQTKKVLDEVTLFYRKFYSRLKKKEEIKKLCANIDEISSSLRKITKLEQCKELETSFNGEYGGPVRARHEEELKKINLKWWEKLDIYDNV